MLTPDEHRRPSPVRTRPSGRLGSSGVLAVSRGGGARHRRCHPPPGEKGEIWVRGEQVAGEYVGNNVLTTTLVPHPGRRLVRRARLPLRRRAARRRDRAGPRTSRPARSKRCSWRTPPWPRPRSSASRRRVGRGGGGRVVLHPGGDASEPTCRSGQGTPALHQNARRRRLPRRAALLADGQAAAAVLRTSCPTAPGPPPPPDADRSAQPLQRSNQTPVTRAPGWYLSILNT